MIGSPEFSCRNRLAAPACPRSGSFTTLALRQEHSGIFQTEPVRFFRELPELLLLARGEFPVIVSLHQFLKPELCSGVEPMQLSPRFLQGDQLSEIDVASLANRSGDSQVDFLDRFLRCEAIEAFDVHGETGRFEPPMKLEHGHIFLCENAP